MKKVVMLVGTIIFVLGMAGAAGAQVVNIPLKVDAWKSAVTSYCDWCDEYGVPRTGPSWQETPDGLQFFGSGYRAGTIAYTKQLANLADATIWLKWKADGGDGYGWYPAPHTYMGANAGVGQWNDTAKQLLGIGYDRVTTNHSWDGSVVIAHDTWYYSRIVITPDRHFTTTIATGNYDDQGGTIFHQLTREIPTDAWAYICQATIFFNLDDNYGAQHATMTIGEAKYLAKSNSVCPDPTPVPEPTVIPISTVIPDPYPPIPEPPNPSVVPEPGTLILLSVGLLGLLGLKKKLARRMK